MALAIILLFPVVLMRTPVDIFPDINIPVISLVWTYNGLQPQEMEQRITSNVERGVTTLVSDVEHIESQSLNGIGEGAGPGQLEVRAGVGRLQVVACRVGQEGLAGGAP